MGVHNAVICAPHMLHGWAAVVCARLGKSCGAHTHNSVFTKTIWTKICNLAIHIGDGTYVDYTLIAEAAAASDG